MTDMPNYGQYNDDVYYTQPSGLTLNQYMTRTFRWMAIGLITTFALAFAIAQTGLFVPIYNSGLIWIITIAEVVLVFSMSARLNSISPSAATTMFFLYAVLNGIMFSVYFVAYRLSTLIGAFLVAALYFAVLAVYGWVTKSDLTGWGTHIFAGLIALLVFQLISMLFGGIGDTLLCVVGLILFMCITAYDMQRIKGYYYATAHDGYMAEKASIYGALNLYLDFINIFLRVLRMFARNRD